MIWCAVATDRSDDILKLSGLSGEFRSPSGERSPVLHSVDLAIRRGVITAIVGETGSGKTLTALTVLGLTPRAFHRTGGSVVFDGTDITDYRERQLAGLRGAQIAMVFQREILSAPQISGGPITSGRIAISGGAEFTREYANALVDRIVR
jgi:ABC-type glutathione transport system ATPase component